MAKRKHLASRSKHGRTACAFFEALCVSSMKTLSLFLIPVLVVSCSTNAVKVTIVPEVDKCKLLGEVTGSGKSHTGVINELKTKALELGGNTVITQSLSASAGLVHIEGGEGGLFYFEHLGTVYNCP